MFLFWFALGTIFGSAANALIDRLPRQISWIRGRSCCDHCGHVLPWHDLLPVVSYLLLGGKCRFCQKTIAFRNLIVELVMGLGFAFLVNPWLIGIFWVTVIIFFMDWETKLVSEWLIVLWGALVVLSNLGNLSNLSYLFGVATGVGLIGGLWAITRGRGMGFGDVEIAAVMGLWLGWPRIVVALWLAFVIGGVIGVIRVIRGISGFKSEIAFGPFLILGTWLAFVWGGDILKKILSYGL